MRAERPRHGSATTKERIEFPPPHDAAPFEIRCRPNAPFAELARLSRISIADEMREEHRRRVAGDRP
jgi:hypothetical protein